MTASAPLARTAARRHRRSLPPRSRSRPRFASRGAAQLAKVSSVDTHTGASYPAPPTITTTTSFVGGLLVGFLIWLEATGLADWVRMSSLGYPLMITCHAFGMAIMVGLSLALDLRLLGRFGGIPYPALQRFLGLAWIGFGINFVSGACLFSAQATTYITDWVFMTKMTLVVLGGDHRRDAANQRQPRLRPLGRREPPAGVRVIARSCRSSFG